MVDRLAAGTYICYYLFQPFLGLSRTNNSIEGWHAIWNTHLRSNPGLSVFCKKMIEEDEMWANRVADYRAAPADGIRGPSTKRKEKFSFSLFTCLCLSLAFLKHLIFLKILFY